MINLKQNYGKGYRGVQRRLYGFTVIFELNFFALFLLYLT